MTADAEQKVAIVTGSTHGIGRAIALRLSRDGVRVVVNCRTDVEAGNAVVAEIAAAGGEAVLAEGDVGQPSELQSLFDSAERAFGRIDIFVHNAAAAHLGSILEASAEDFDRVYNVNARALFLGFAEAGRRMRDGGRLLFISSSGVRHVVPGGGLYHASKAAGEALMRPFAEELGPRGITVNAVEAGVTRTRSTARLSPEILDVIAQRTALRRIGEPEDVAEVIAFLASDSGRWITGQVVQASGGT
jgi:3-oxoacyl-[acyl-carrier protein] reductase